MDSDTTEFFVDFNLFMDDIVFENDNIGTKGDFTVSLIEPVWMDEERKIG